MEIKSKYEKEILRELRGISHAKLPAVLKLIHLVKDELLSVSKQKKKRANAMVDVDKFAIETGITDLAKNHDHYLYGVERDG